MKAKSCVFSCGTHPPLWHHMPRHTLALCCSLTHRPLTTRRPHMPRFLSLSLSFYLAHVRLEGRPATARKQGRFCGAAIDDRWYQDIRSWIGVSLKSKTSKIRLIVMFVYGWMHFFALSNFLSCRKEVSSSLHRLQQSLAHFTWTYSTTAIHACGLLPKIIISALYYCPSGLMPS